MNNYIIIASIQRENDVLAIGVAAKVARDIQEQVELKHGDRSIALISADCSIAQRPVKDQ